MSTASEGVAVIATQVARTDRRALSQAWYSALHLARDVAPPQTAPHRTSAGTPPPTLALAPARHAATGAAATAPAPSGSRRATRSPGADAGVAVERRRPHSEPERRVGRAIARLASRPRIAVAHTVALNGGRVRLLVQNDGRTTRIVALCSPALREPVARAVACARFALAGAGIAVGAP